MKALLALIKKLYGSKALSKTIGTRTNVITLPDKETKRFVSNELNIDAASDAAVKKAYEDVEKLIPDIPKMNDQEILTLTGNLRRLDQRINPPSAEVISIGTKQPVSKEGIASLTEQAGQMSPPGSLMGNLESRINQLRASGKKLEDITKGKGVTLDDLLKDPTRSGGPLDPKVGIVRTAAREILEKNLKAGKIDIPDEAAKDAILKSSQGGVDPIDVLRKTYGEGILEDLDDIAEELNRAKDYKQIQKILQREELFDAAPKKDYGYDPGVMSDQEMSDFLKTVEPKVIPADSDEGKAITDMILGQPKPKGPKATVTELLTAEKIIADMNKMDPMDAMYEANKVLKKEGKYKDLSGDDVDRIMKETEDNIFQRNITEEPEDFATGGRVGFKEGTPEMGMMNPKKLKQVQQMIKMGADVSTISSITGLSEAQINQIQKSQGKAEGGRVGFQEGGNIYNMYQDGSNETDSTQTSPVGSTFNPTMMDILGFALNPVVGIANLASRKSTGLSLAQRAMDAFGIGRGPGGRTAGFGVDSIAGIASGPTHGVDAVNSQSVGADASAGGAAGAAAASAAGANDGPAGGTFAQGGRVEMASGGITALKALLKFFAEQKGKKGSDMLKEINPKRLGFLQNMLRKSDKDMLDTNRQEYLEDLSDIIKSDKKLLDRIKEMPEEARETFFTMANEGGNRGRLSVYKDPDFNIEDAIGEIEQMKKNLKFKDVPEKEVKRQMNASGGVAYLMGL